MDQFSEAGTERVRTMANSILERFNEEQVSPEEAGWGILALTHRLLKILEENPAERQAFVLQFISLINQYLAGDFEKN
jgi:hypothetical protein